MNFNSLFLNWFGFKHHYKILKHKSMEICYKQFFSEVNFVNILNK